MENPFVGTLTTPPAIQTCKNAVRSLNCWPKGPERINPNEHHPLQRRQSKDASGDAIIIYMSSFLQMGFQIGLEAPGDSNTKLCSCILFLTKMVHSTQYFGGTIYVPGIAFGPRHSIGIKAPHGLEQGTGWKTDATMG